MKTIPFFLLSILILTSIPIASSTSAKDDKQDDVDPIVGRWRWYNGMIVTFAADGTASSDGHPGKWKRIGTATPQKYEINWSDRYIDTVYLRKRSGNSFLEGKDLEGRKISGTKIE